MLLMVQTRSSVFMKRTRYWKAAALIAATIPAILFLCSQLCWYFYRAPELQIREPHIVPPSSTVLSMDPAAVASSSRLLAPEDDSAQLRPRIVLIFLTTSGLQTGSIWHDWFQDAREFMITQRWIDIDTRDAEVPYLQAVMTYHPNHTEVVHDLVLPGWITKDDRPVWGRWARLLGVVQRGFELALLKHPEGTYFILSSDTTVPLKSFEQIAGEIMVDGRSRFDIFCYNFWGYYFKHSQWIMLSRDHAQLLAEDIEWTKPAINWVKGKPPCRIRVAATDEYFPGKTILTKRGGAGELANVNTRAAIEGDMLNAWTLVYWPIKNAPPPKFFGVLDTVHGHPATFATLTSSFLRLLVQRQGMWFLRKTTDEALVSDCSKPLEQYYVELMGKSIPPSSINDTCLLRSFLPLLWKKDRRGHVQIVTSSTAITEGG
eukprot:Protomagalhaensia_sp_Gyna_25__331@NODE_1155_length_2129_cov_339_466507_g917_i0_p1_GENE_NODE_1155_length_2129_cov_339_466507_g917_i0NODE_1155_length_2129_cov_339_466507_g917_i0_p1_ORF_typecomplete_len431_score30_80Branch/PF02485_21/3_4e10_NODE_1155_length_2129_cov_339_466507_g917_i07322024